MRKSNNIEILKTARILKTEEQETFRIKLGSFMNLSGIIAICLEASELYVEYNPQLFNLDSFKLRLIEMEFPLETKRVLV